MYVSVWTYLHTCCMRRAGNKAGEQKGEPNPPLVPPAAGPPRTHRHGFGGGGQVKCTPAFHQPPCPHCTTTLLQPGLRCMEGFPPGFRCWEGLGHAAQHARRAAVDQISFPSEIALTLIDSRRAGIWAKPDRQANTDPSRTRGPRSIRRQSANTSSNAKRGDSNKLNCRDHRHGGSGPPLCVVSILFVPGFDSGGTAWQSMAC
ncbi:hypothetical protein B0I37DRAFT_173637 [Chaetomium sp. MPI-CAGE-AT-0009]|nr:hypothetical protein B0I37DRAFT_173637 [Chaetomium sp. MPI-CAGE-AT-0009]